MGDMCMCIPNVKFLCLTLCQGEVCTDDDDDANDGQSMVVEGSLVDKPNEPKNNSFFQHPIDIILRTGRPISLQTNAWIIKVRGPCWDKHFLLKVTQ